jgi:hypothetical protein
MVLLADEAQVEGLFSPFGDIAKRTIGSDVI